MANGIRINQLTNFKGAQYTTFQDLGDTAKTTLPGYLSATATNTSLVIGSTLKLKKVETTEGYAASYKLGYGANDDFTPLGDSATIDIMKDKFVKEGSLVWSTSQDAPAAGNSQAAKDATHIYPAIKLVLWTTVNPDADVSDSGESTSEIYFPIASMFTDYEAGYMIDATQLASGTIAVDKTTVNNDVIGPVNTAISGSVDSVNEAIGGSVASVNAGLTATVASVNTAVDSVVASVNSAITGSVNSVNTALTTTVSNINTAVNGAISDTVDSINTAVKTAVDAAISSTVDSINSALAGTVESVNSAIADHRGIVTTDVALSSGTITEAGAATISGITGRVIKVFQGNDEVYPEITCVNGTNTLTADFASSAAAAAVTWTIIHTAATADTSEAATATAATATVAATAGTAAATAGSATASAATASTATVTAASASTATASAAPLLS